MRAYLLQNRTNKLLVLANTFKPKAPIAAHMAQELVPVDLFTTKPRGHAGSIGGRGRQVVEISQRGPLL